MCAKSSTVWEGNRCDQSGSPGRGPGGVTEDVPKVVPDVEKTLYLCGRIDLQETLVTPLNPHFGHALWAAFWRPRRSSDQQTRPRNRPSSLFMASPPQTASRLSWKKRWVCCHRRGIVTMGHGVMATLNMQILEGKRSSGHHTFHRSQVCEFQVRNTFLAPNQRHRH